MDRDFRIYERNSVTSSSINTEMECRENNNSKRSFSNKIDESNISKVTENIKKWQHRIESSKCVKMPICKSNSNSSISSHKRQQYRPDLVMDLPLDERLIAVAKPKVLQDVIDSYMDAVQKQSNNNKNNAHSSNPDSSVIQTTSEWFAVQSQCTLKKKKNTKSSDSLQNSSDNSGSSVVRAVGDLVQKLNLSSDFPAVRNGSNSVASTSNIQVAVEATDSVATNNSASNGSVNANSIYKPQVKHLSIRNFKHSFDLSSNSKQ